VATSPNQHRQNVSLLLGYIVIIRGLQALSLALRLINCHCPPTISNFASINFLSLGYVYLRCALSVMIQVNGQMHETKWRSDVSSVLHLLLGMLRIIIMKRIKIYLYVSVRARDREFMFDKNLK